MENLKQAAELLITDRMSTDEPDTGNLENQGNIQPFQEKKEEKFPIALRVNDGQTEVKIDSSRPHSEAHSSFDWNKDDENAQKENENVRDTPKKPVFAKEKSIPYPVKLICLLIVCVILLLIPKMLNKVEDPVLGLTPSDWSVAAACIFGAMVLEELLIITAFYFAYKHSSLHQRDYLDYLHKLHFSFRNLLWSITIIVMARAFMKNFDDPKSQEERNIKSTTIGLLVSGILFFLEKLLVQKVAYNFHEMAYRHRFVENNYDCEILTHLNQCRKKARKPFNIALRKSADRNYLEPERDNIYTLHHESEISLDEHEQSPIELKTRTTLMEDVKSFTKKFRFIKNMNRYKLEQHETTGKSKKIAKENFLFLCPSHREYLLMEDFSKYFTNKSALKDVFSRFDADGNGKISKYEFKRMVISTYKEKANLSRSMLDTSNALEKLDNIFLILTLIVVLFIWFPLFGVDLASLLPLTVSAFIAAGVIFGTSAKNFFDSVILIFVSHPFDIGDK
jgi:Ca2+-binding EF-hand superfamily protein